MEAVPVEQALPKLGHPCTVRQALAVAEGAQPGPPKCLANPRVLTMQARMAAARIRTCRAGVTIRQAKGQPTSRVGLAAWEAKVRSTHLLPTWAELRNQAQGPDHREVPWPATTPSHTRIQTKGTLPPAVAATTCPVVAASAIIIRRAVVTLEPPLTIRQSTAPVPPLAATLPTNTVAMILVLRA